LFLARIKRVLTNHKKRITWITICKKRLQYVTL